jgi:hypothetical protein
MNFHGSNSLFMGENEMRTIVLLLAVLCGAAAFADPPAETEAQRKARERQELIERTRKEAADKAAEKKRLLEEQKIANAAGERRKRMDARLRELVKPPSGIKNAKAAAAAQQAYSQFCKDVINLIPIIEDTRAEGKEYELPEKEPGKQVSKVQATQRAYQERVLATAKALLDDEKNSKELTKKRMERAKEEMKK